MKNQKILLLLFVLIIIIVAVSALMLQKSKNDKTTKQDTINLEQNNKPEETKLEPMMSESTTTDGSEILTAADWNVYKNEKYGFEFKYPKTLKVNEIKNTLNINFTSNNQNIWSINLYDNNSKLPLKDWLSSNFNKANDKDCKISSSNITIGDSESLLFSSESLDESCENGAYYTISPDKSFILKWQLGQDPVYLGAAMDSFKFTKE